MFLRERMVSSPGHKWQYLSPVKGNSYSRPSPSLASVWRRLPTDSDFSSWSETILTLSTARPQSLTPLDRGTCGCATKIQRRCTAPYQVWNCLPDEVDFESPDARTTETDSRSFS